MVAAIGTGIIFLNVDFRMADRPDRTPVETAEVDDQIWSHVTHAAVNFFRLEDQRIQRLTFLIRERFQTSFHFVLERFVLGRWNHALWLPSLNVEEYAGLVSASAPYSSLAPIYIEFVEGRKRLGIFVQNQQPFADEPFVDGETSFETLPPMARNDQHDSVIRQQLKDRANLLIQP